MHRCDHGIPRAPKALMNFHFTFGPIASLVAGILILVVPRLLNYIVAIYLIIIGLVGLSAGSGFV